MWFVCSALVVCLAGLAAPAATLERLSLDDMTSRSTAIVRARAVSSSTVQIGSIIYTKTRFEVLERWKGPDAAQVDVTEPGGTRGGASEHYVGVPHFSPGQELVLFLWTGPSGRTQVIGLSQGALQVARTAPDGDAQVIRQPSGETMVAPGTGKPVQEEAISMSLGRLALRIQSTLAQAQPK